MVGGPTFDASLAALRPFGRLAIYGMAGRVPPKPLEPAKLGGTTRGVIGFFLPHCLAREDMFRPQVDELLGSRSTRATPRRQMRSRLVVSMTTLPFRSPACSSACAITSH
jgi:hypothetical protein